MDANRCVGSHPWSKREPCTPANRLLCSVEDLMLEAGGMARRRSAAARVSGVRIACHSGTGSAASGDGDTGGFKDSAAENRLESLQQVQSVCRTVPCRETISTAEEAHLACKFHPAKRQPHAEQWRVGVDHASASLQQSSRRAVWCVWLRAVSPRQCHLCLAACAARLHACTHVTERIASPRPSSPMQSNQVQHTWLNVSRMKAFSATFSACGQVGIY